MSELKQPQPQERSAAPQPKAAERPSVLRTLIRQSRFLAAAGVLLVCAAGFNAAARSLQLHFRKQPVPLAVKALDDKAEGIPAKLGGRWVQVTDDQPLSGDVEHALGTKQYVMRTYVNLEAAHRTEAELADRDPRRIAGLLGDLQARKPEAIIRVAITYYTGLVDTVAHIPDRCMVADGYQPTDYKVIGVPDDSANSVKRDAKFRFITFEDITGRSRVTRNVGYFFHVNGRYEENPLGVRATLQDLFQTYGYYAKVELMTEQPGRGDAAASERSSAAMKDFLTALLPEVERCLPDWQKVTGQNVPRSESVSADGA